MSRSAFVSSFDVAFIYPSHLPGQRNHLPRLPRLADRAAPDSARVWDLVEAAFLRHTHFPPCVDALRQTGRFSSSLALVGIVRRQTEHHLGPFHTRGEGTEAVALRRHMHCDAEQVETAARFRSFRLFGWEEPTGIGMKAYLTT